MKPIGYWLNRTDQALTRYMDGMLGESGLTRIAWQVLNVIESGTSSDAHVLTYLGANADAATLSAAIETFVADGWADRPAPGELALTAEGAERLAKVAVRVDAFRELSVSGISHEDYRTAVQVLERITANLAG